MNEPSHRCARNLVGAVLPVPDYIWGTDFEKVRSQPQHSRPHSRLRDATTPTQANRGKIFRCRCVGFVPGVANKPESTEKFYFIDHHDGKKNMKICELTFAGLKACFATLPPCAKKSAPAELAAGAAAESALQNKVVCGMHQYDKPAVQHHRGRS